MHERGEFNEEASNFTRMDMNTKDALATLANLAQVRSAWLLFTSWLVPLVLHITRKPYPVGRRFHPTASVRCNNSSHLWGTIRARTGIVPIEKRSTVRNKSVVLPYTATLNTSC